jgi:RNA polymerase sigma-70 factor (ECF subfamily)
VNDDTEAEEVLQDVVLQAWTRGASYDATLGSPAGWLVTIARSRAMTDGACTPATGWRLHGRIHW